ncbi:Arc family DNA-binding protein [Geminicoccus sp.]|uniref:Arc family DNA-binding protein n=1 Tax=Geminicoccus sp. TaxID=2024832 RepID=UPI0032C22855
MRPETQSFKLRLPPDTLCWLREQAAQRRRSMNSEIIFLLEMARREASPARGGEQTAGVASQA